MKWVTASDIDRWADSINARTELSEIVSALVRASAADVRAFRFPTGDSAQIPGYDGRLIATGAPPYVPDGESVWEFGTDVDYLKKANDDLKTRTENPRGVDPSSATFVFVTPRIWKNPKVSIEAWINERKQTNPWKSITVIDAVGLEDWLSNHDAVGKQVARRLGRGPQAGVQSTDEFWESYASRFKTPLPEAVLLCDRADQAKELLSSIDRGAGEIPWLADSPSEVVAFAVAAIRSTEPEIRKFLEARTVIVESEDAAKQLALQRNMVFIAAGVGAIRAGGLLARQNPTVIPFGRDTYQKVPSLNRFSTSSLSSTLQTMGLNPDDANRLARISGRSVTILQRHYASAQADKPHWLDDGVDLIAALLAGGWDAGWDADKLVLAELAHSNDYDEYERRLRPLLKTQDPPIDQEGSVWKLRAPVDAFVHLGHRLTKKDLDQFKCVATEVFKETDTSLDLSEEDEQKNIFSLGTRTRLTHSEWLRDGLATTLLLISALHKEAQFSVAGIKPTTFVEDIVLNLPGLAKDYRVMASLRNQLPLLMEAAPDPLLSALEQMLGGDGSKCRPIFRKGGLFGRTSPHTYFLWALEAAAWDPEYLTRVSLVLARMARIDPGGETINRPLNSLREIFLSWHPGTHAPLSQRLAALDAIIRDEPIVGWNLVASLLPEHQGVSHNTVKPRFREAGQSDAERLTWAVVFQSYREIVTRALSIAGNDVRRWTQIIETMANFEPQLREQTYDALGAFIGHANPEQRTELWNVLRDEVNRHKKFPDAEWSLKDTDLNRLYVMLEALQPIDPLGRDGWLFGEDYPELGGRDWENDQNAVEQQRMRAVREIFEGGKENAVVAFAKKVRLPYYVGRPAVEVAGNIDVIDRLINLSLGTESLDSFLIALSAEAEKKFGIAWLDRLKQRASESKWGAKELGLLLLSFADVPRTWELAESLGKEVEKEYWTRKKPWWLKGDVAETERAVEKYLAVGRATAALEAIHSQVEKISAKLVYSILDRAIQEVNAGRVTPNSIFIHEVGDVLDRLTKRNDVPPVEIAKREYAYLPLLGHRNRRLALHQMMASDPELYVSILCDVFRGASATPEDPTPERRARAEAGYRLLSSFHRVPGTAGERVNRTELQSWISGVRRLAEAKDRAKIADEYIGHLLAHSPNDSTGNWPHETMAELLELFASSDIETGIKIERFNMRGVVQKAIFEGGRQERDLAEKYRAWAGNASAFPRTSKLLNAIAKDWDQMAAEEEERAAKDKLRYE